MGRVAQGDGTPPQTQPLRRLAMDEVVLIAQKLVAALPLLDRVSHTSFSLWMTFNSDLS